MTPVEIQRKGWKALVNALGYVDAIRFIRQFDSGSGDYTKQHFLVSRLLLAPLPYLVFGQETLKVDFYLSLFNFD